MAQWVDIPLATQQGQALSAYASDAQLTNLMLVKTPPGSAKPFYVSHAPGLTVSAGPGSGRIRGMCKRADGVIFMIQGTTVFYTANAGSSWSSLGAGTMPGTGFCRMADAGTHMVAVDGTNAQAFTTAASTACSRGNFSDVAYQDGFTIFTETGSNSVYVSNVDDPTTISALNFTTADALPGNVLAVVSDHREVTVFKNGSLERYYNAGASGFPFARSSPGVIETGLCQDMGGSTTDAFNTVVKSDNTLFWVSPDFRVYAMRGGGVPVVISTPWVEKYMFAAMPATTAPFGVTYTLDGITQYLISGFRESGQRTAIVYDITTGLWHKRYSSAGVDKIITHAVDVQAGGIVNDRVLVALFDAGTLSSSLGEMRTATIESTLTRTMTLPTYAPSDGTGRVFMPELYLDMQKASAATTLTLAWSDDGGTTYTSEKAGTANVSRTRWQRLGSFLQRILRFTFTINSALAIMGVRARIEVGE